MHRDDALRSTAEAIQAEFPNVHVTWELSDGEDDVDYEVNVSGVSSGQSPEMRRFLRTVRRSYVRPADLEVSFILYEPEEERFLPASARCTASD